MRRSRSFLSLKFPAWCILVSGLAVSLALFFWAYRQEQQSERVNFERRAQFRAAAVQQGVTNAIESLQVVNQFFVTNGSVSRDQFHSFTQPLRARYPFIEAFAFGRLVSQAERPAFEAQMRTRYPGFTIDEMVGDKRVVAPLKDSYRVIDYLEPMTGNDAAFGLDVSSGSFLYDAIRRANDTGLPSATGLFRLFKDTGAERGFRIFMAVYKGGAVPDDVESRRSAVVGYTVAVLRAGVLFEKILASAGTFGNAGLDVRVYAGASADDSTLAYGHASGVATENRNGWRPAWLFGNRPELFSHDFDVAGTAWHMLIAPEPPPFSAMHTDALFALLMGLLTTLAATFYLQSVALREQRIQQLVAKRTDELKQVNDLLIEDINARKQVEQALLISENRLRNLADLSSDWFWELDEHFRYTTISTGVMGTATDVTGKEGDPPPVVLGAIRWELPVDLNASDWPAHRAMLEAHQPFKNFEFKTLYTTLIDGMPVQWISASGKPLFDACGHFKGYRGTSRNISDRKQAEEALSHSRSELRKLANHQQSIKEEERKRIARDVHDGLGQDLIALRIDVSMMAAGPDSVAVTKEQLDATLNQIDATIEAVRVIINDLRPAALDIGLHAAIEWQVTEFERRSGIACELHVDHDEFALDDKRATALFRVVQESLTNIIRHAQASRIRIEMRRKDDTLFMTIADDGIGLSPACRSKANVFGLIGIRERIHALGGTFSTASNPDQGTAIKLSIPI